MRYKFLIYISYPYSIPIGLPLQREIENRGDEVFWFADVPETMPLLHKNSKLIKRIEDVVEYNPDIVLCATDTVPDFLQGLKVQVFHGFSANKRSFKKDHFRIRGFFDLYTTHGPSTTRVFKNLAKKYRTFDVIETGWPKVDALFTDKNTDLAKSSPIPTLLISSTFTKRLSLAYNPEVFSEIARLSETGKYKFHCVLHPKLDGEIKQKFSNLNGKHFQYHDTTNFTELFSTCDGMLSDTTSVISEFALLKKPIVTFRNNLPQDFFLNVTEVVDIEPAINRALQYPKDLISAMEGFILDSHPYQDGKSSKRVINAVISFLHQDKSHIKTKPCNLVRKYKLRKNLGYFTWNSYNKAKTV